MTRTVGDIISAARGIVQDETTPYRYSDNSIAGYVSEAITEMRRVRPDLFLETLYDDIPIYTLSDLAVVVPTPDFYFSQIVNYVAGRTDLREDQFAQDGRAATLIVSFGVSLTGGNR